MQICFKNGPPISLKEVAKAALRFERRQASGIAIAAQDVYAITYGGLHKISTTPNTKKHGVIVDGAVSLTPVSHDARWLSEHVVVAFDPVGKRHDAPGLLAKLVKHADRKRIVRRISAYADQACLAIQKKRLKALALMVEQYKKEFDSWTGSEYTFNVREIGAKLEDEMPLKVLAWKPPGGGASKSLIVISPDVESRDAVIRFFEKENWWATPAYVTNGVSGEYLRSNGEVRITAGHRLDFVGAADLGQDMRIGVKGRCCSCAIEPRTEMLWSPGKPRFEPHL